jgi:biotin synthase
MMKIDSEVENILYNVLEGKSLRRDDAIKLMNVNVNSIEMYALMAVANSATRKLFNSFGEVHAQIGINYAPCPNKCKFCVFSVADKNVELSLNEVLEKAEWFIKEGANAIFLMTTANYDFDKFIKIGRAVREAIPSKMPLVANIGDFGNSEAKELLDAGFTAIYHVVRLREGIDTKIDPSDRLRTIKAAKSVGLDLSYCVEPIGPEHTPEEIVDAMFLGKELKPTVMATMRRIPVPGTPLAKFGQITQLEQAKIEAITRLVIGDDILAMGVHEAYIPCLMSGANQIYAETGPNPRDAIIDTTKGRGLSVRSCRTLLQEAGFTPRDGPARSLQGPIREGKK